MKTKMSTVAEAADLEAALEKHAEKHEAAKLKLLTRHSDQLTALKAKGAEDRKAIVSVYSGEAVELLERLAKAKTNA